MSFMREAIMRGISRRAFLQGAGALAAAPLLTGWGVKAALAASPGGTTRHCNPYFIDSNTTPCPPLEPFLVYRNPDTNVIVRATLVDHHQVFPSLAYRFDTPDGSVVISGDTGADTCGNLQKLARGADVLVHEVIDEAWIEVLAGTGFPAPLIEHLNAVHTKIGEVGRVAEECRVRTLVLNHIVPGNAPVGHLVKAKQDFSGELIIGEDLMQIVVGKAGGAKAWASQV